MKVAGAPITWGVCEVPGWGVQLSPDRVLGEIASLGIAAVELGPPGFLPDEPAAARRTLEGHGLTLAGGFVTAVLHRAERLERVVAEVARRAAALAAAGAPVLVLAAALDAEGYERSAALTEAEWDTLAAGLAAADVAARNEGVGVALHPHYGTAVERADQVARIVNRCHIGFCIDTGHLMVGGADPVEVIRMTAGRVAHVHLKDVDAGLAARVRHGAVGYRDAVALGMYRPLGEGDVDFPAVLDLLATQRYDGWYVLEQDAVLGSEPPAGTGPVEAAARSLDFLTRIPQRQ